MILLHRVYDPQTIVMPGRWLSLLLTLISLTKVAYCVDYVNRTQGIQHFPDDIPWAVQLIDLTGNDISEVHFYREFPFLRKVNVQKNNLTSFPTTAQNVTNTFKILQLSANKIGSIDAVDVGDASAYGNLTILLLDNNKLTVFPDLTNLNSTLQQLYLEYNQITTIPFERLNVLEKLVYIGLSHNPITFIPDTTFLGQIQKISLNELNMTHFPHIPNFLHSAKDINFNGNTNNFIFDYIDPYESLTNLYLAGCKFTGEFPSLSNVSSSLVVLDMSDSGVTEIPSLGNLKELRWLLLNQNPISVIPDANLGSPELVIELKDVSITEFPILPHIGPILTILAISNNNLTIKYIGHLDNLEKLQMENCKYGGYFPNLVNVSQTLQYLELSQNDISYIDPDYLNALVKLQELRLYNNPISVIPDVPGPSDTLTLIELSNSNLNEFPNIPQLGRSLRQLHIKGEYQRYQRVQLQRLRNLPVLELLDLSQSPIKYLPDFTRLYLAKPLTIKLEDTTIDCDNNVKMLNLMMLGNRVKIPTPSPKCLESSVFSGPINQLKPNDFKQVHKEGRVHHGSSRRLSDLSSYQAYLKVDEILPDTVRGSCSLKCMVKDSCIMFATDSGACALTTWAAGSEEQFNQYTEWYMLD